MTQYERWQARYEEVKAFIESNHRNPSKHRIEEHDMLNWVNELLCNVKFLVLFFPILSNSFQIGKFFLSLWQNCFI